MLGDAHRISGSKLLLLGAVWVCAGITVAGFFAPWVSVRVDPAALLGLEPTDQSMGQMVDDLQRKYGHIVASIRQGDQTVSGSLPTFSDFPEQFRGVDIPRLARHQDAKLAAALFETLTENRRPIIEKSSAVYAVPMLALVLALTLSLGWALRPIRAAVALSALGFFGFGLWRCLNVASSAAFQLKIETGLWICLAAYAAMAGVALLSLIQGRKVDTLSAVSL